MLRYVIMISTQNATYKMKQHKKEFLNDLELVDKNPNIHLFLKYDA